LADHEAVAASEIFVDGIAVNTSEASTEMNARAPRGH
jgi:hypothetical protein